MNIDKKSDIAKGERHTIFMCDWSFAYIWYSNDGFEIAESSSCTSISVFFLLEHCIAEWSNNDIRKGDATYISGFPPPHMEDIHFE